MANYTMTLKQINDEPLYHWFIKDYPFYVDDDDAKKEFEQKFYDYYFDREIGFETVERYLMKMKGYLRLKMPYYQLMYETILRTKNIEFMLNKDLRETFIREVDSENQTTGTTSGQQNASSSNSVSQNGTSNNTHKESSIQDGVSVASLTDGYLTGASGDNGTSTSTGTSQSSDSLTSKGTSTQTDNGKTLEKTELLSQGNIGITSSAQLLREWRDVLLDMDELIIKDLEFLFMRIY